MHQKVRENRIFQETNRHNIKMEVFVGEEDE